MPLNFSDKIYLKPQYSHHEVAGSRVFLFAESDTYVLHGRYFSTLIPLIAEQVMTVEEIIVKTHQRIQPHFILYALEQLLKENLISRTPIEKAHKIDVELPESLINKNENAEIIGHTVVVTGFGLPQSVVKTFIKEIERYGVTVDATKSAEINILLCNDYLNKALEATIKGFDRENQHWIIVKPVGKKIWVGPVSKNNVCWDCVISRLLGNRLGQHMFTEDLQESSIPPLNQKDTESNSLIKLTALFASRAFDDGFDVSETIQILDVESQALSNHFILPDPACLHKIHDVNIESKTSNPLLLTHKSENGYRTMSTEDTYSEINKLVSPISGLIPELNRSDQYDSSYIYYAQHSFGQSHTLSANRITGKPSWACGKGETDIDARVSCIAEAIERYSSGYFGNEEMVNARMTDLENAMHPNEILLFSDHQYKTRDSSNLSRNDFNWVPEEFDAELVLDWVQFKSISNTEDIYLPAKFAYINYPDVDDGNSLRADSNGCATGNNIEEAILFALFELIERDSVAIWWFNELFLPTINYDSFDDHSIISIKSSLSKENRELITLDITTNIGIHTFVSISWDVDSGNKIYIGYGTHLDPLIAIKRSLNEVMQIASYIKENPGINNPVLNKWIHSTTIKDLPFLTGKKNTVKQRNDFLNMITGDIQGDINTCVGLLNESDVNVYTLDVTRSMYLLPTVRVVAPGLRHFWPRLAAGRLFDVPIEMGLVTEQKRESDLNKYFYPL